MKIRNGFISNSSSSSFVVALKPGVNAESEMLKAMKTPEGHPLRSFAVDISKIFRPKLIDTDELNEMLNPEWSYNHQKYKDLIDQGFVLYEILVGSDYDEPMSVYLYTNGLPFEVENDQIVVIQRY